MRFPAVVLALLLLAGCTGADEPDAAPSSAPTGSSTTPSDPAPDPDTDPDTAPDGPLASAGPEVVASEACAEVRAGIDAFNAGDFDETVERFEAAVPLAEEQADGSTASDQLVEAVRWYAELPAEDYLEAASTSADFQRFKAITLGQCVAGPGLPPPSEPGVET